MKQINLHLEIQSCLGRKKYLEILPFAITGRYNCERYKWLVCFSEDVSGLKKEHRKHGSESVRKTESFDSFFVREMTHRELKCVKWHTLVHGVSSHGQKMSQMTQFYVLTHFHVFCEGGNWFNWHTSSSFMNLRSAIIKALATFNVFLSLSHNWLVFDLAYSWDFL